MRIYIKKWLIVVLIAGLGLQSYAQENVLDNKFLIVLDVQNRDTKWLESDPSFQAFMESINTSIRLTKTKNVIYTMGTHIQLNLSFSLPNIYLSIDSKAMCLDEKMDKVNQNIFLKEENMGNAFNVERLNDFLKKNNAKEIILIGLMAEECVYQSCIGGLEQAYDMYIIPEAIIGQSAESKDKVIKELTEKGIKILHLNALRHK